MIQKYKKLFCSINNPQILKSTSNKSPAQLSFLYQPCSQTTRENPPNLIILHGIMGSSKNFRGISHNQKIASKVNTYLLDLRNHGKSGHKDSMSYPEMVEDVHEFLFQNDLLDDDNIFLGHSMGGRLTMEFATRYPYYVKGAIVVDLAPYNYFEDKRFTFIDEMAGMMERLTKIELSKDITALRNDIISASLSKEIGEVIATNIVPDGQGGYKWRINLEAINKNFKSQVVNLEYKGTNKYKGPVRVILGCNSEYTSRDIVPSFHKVFENLNEEKDVYFVSKAGHWVHYNQPYVFIDLVSDFLDKFENSR